MLEELIEVFEFTEPLLERKEFLFSFTFLVNTQKEKNHFGLIFYVEL